MNTSQLKLLMNRLLMMWAKNRQSPEGHSVAVRITTLLGVYRSLRPDWRRLTLERGPGWLG
jgi:hypothetical protein